MKQIYLDYNASVPFRDGSFTKTLELLSCCFGNPSSVYSLGRSSRQVLNQALESCAYFLGCSSSQLFITSGGSESNSWIFYSYGLTSLQKNKKPRFLISSIEHESNYLAALSVAKNFSGSVDFIKTNENGTINIDDLEKYLKVNTYDLISVIYAHNETGVLQPMNEVVGLAQKYNTPIHSDTVQALGKVPLNLIDSNLDYASFSGHKVGAPKGVGLLYSKSKAKDLHPMIYGTQQNYKRGGTENTVGISILGKILNEFGEESINFSNELKIWHTEFETKLKKKYSDLTIFGENAPRLSNTSLIAIPGVPGESLVMSLDSMGICVSSGSACSSGSVKPSRALTSMGISSQKTIEAVRYSSGFGTKKEDFDKVLDVLTEIIQRIRFNNENFRHIIKS